MNSTTPQLAKAIKEAIDQLPKVYINGYDVEFVAPLVAHITDNGTTLAVSDYYCPHCRDNNDGEMVCIHKLALRQAWRYALRCKAQERRFHEAIAADDHADNAEIGCMVPDVDERREAHYQAGHYPPAPVYY